jgi:hypothetical protein
VRSLQTVHFSNAVQKVNILFSGRSCIELCARPIQMEEVMALGSLRMGNKTGWLWSLYISALATSGYAREAFDVVELMSSKGKHILDDAFRLFTRVWSQSFFSVLSLFQGVPAHWMQQLMSVQQQSAEDLQNLHSACWKCAFRVQLHLKMHVLKRTLRMSETGVQYFACLWRVK